MCPLHVTTVVSLAHKDRAHINIINIKLDAAQQNGKMIRWPSKVVANKTSEDSCIIYLMIFTSISGGTFPHWIYSIGYTQQEEINQTPRK